MFWLKAKCGTRALPPEKNSWVKRESCSSGPCPMWQGKDLKWCEMPQLCQRETFSSTSSLWQWLCKADVRSIWQLHYSQEGAASHLGNTGPQREDGRPLPGVTAPEFWGIPTAKAFSVSLGVTPSDFEKLFCKALEMGGNSVCNELFSLTLTHLISFFNCGVCWVTLL